MFSNSYDPFKMMASGIALWADTARTVQSQYIATATLAAEQIPGTLEWKTMDIPVFTGNPDQSEKYLQEIFRTAADINVNAWAHTANLLASMPNWTQWSTQVPGRAITDMFDKVRTKQSWSSDQKS